MNRTVTIVLTAVITVLITTYAIYWAQSRRIALDLSHSRASEGADSGSVGYTTSVEVWGQAPLGFEAWATWTFGSGTVPGGQLKPASEGVDKGD